MTWNTVTVRDLPPRTVIFGPEGIGKTTFAAGFPNPVFVCTEAGADALPVEKFKFPETEPGEERVLPQDWDEFMVALEEIAEDSHGHETLVIDTWNYATALAADMVCKRDFRGKWADTSHGFLAWGGKQGWGATAEEMRAAIALLDRCREEHEMHIVLLLHEGLVTVKDPIRGDFNKYAGDTAGPLWNLAAQWADVIGHATYDYQVHDTRDSKGRSKKGWAEDSERRMVRFAGTAAEAAKCRVGYYLPAEMEFTSVEFFAQLGTDNATLQQVQEHWPDLSPSEVKKITGYLGTADLKKASAHKLRVVKTQLEARAKRLAAETSIDSNNEGEVENV